MGTQRTQRVTAADLTRHLINQTPRVRRLVRLLRSIVLRAAPGATEAMKFHTLCYYKADAFFGAIGGNICMIEIKGDTVALSFIQGAGLPDPRGLLRGKGKSKRFLDIPDEAFARRREVAALIRASARDSRVRGDWGDVR